MSFLLALVYSCSDSGDNSDYSEMLKKDFNQEIKWDVDSLALMRASWEKTDLGNGAAVCTAQASMWGTTQSVSYVVYPTTMFSTRVAVCDTPAGIYLQGQIRSDPILTWIYNNNMLMKIVLQIFG